MSGIQLYEGPSPAVMSSFYAEGQPAPLFGQSYPGQISDTYHANGLEQHAVLAGGDVEVISAEVLASVKAAAEARRSYLGPVVGPEGEVVPGVALWAERARAAGSQLLSVA